MPVISVDKYKTDNSDLEISFYQDRLPRGFVADSVYYLASLKQVLYSALFDETLRRHAEEHEKLRTSGDYLSKIEDLIQCLDEFPDSYNQVLLSGSLRYFSRAIISIQTKSKPEQFSEILEYIKNFISQADKLLNQLDTEREALVNLNLQRYEDRFDIIEEKCTDSAIMPSLDELTFSSPSE